MIVKKATATINLKFQIIISPSPLPSFLLL